MKPLAAPGGRLQETGRMGGEYRIAELAGLRRLQDARKL
jgi:hypothetical protein